MESQGRRLSVASTASCSSSVKRPASTAENAAKALVLKPKKRPALANLTNQANAGRNVSRSVGKKVQSTSSASKTKKGISAQISTTGLRKNSLCVPPIAKLTSTDAAHLNTSVKRTSSALPNLHPCNSAFSPTKAIGAAVSAGEILTTCGSLPPPSFVKQATTTSQNCNTLQKNDGMSVPPILQIFYPSSSPSVSDAASISMDESMSTCESLNSPDIEYIDNDDSSAVASLERRTCNNLFISEVADPKEGGDIWRKDIFLGSAQNDMVMDLDDNHNDPQLCASFASDIYEHLHESETKKRPSTDFMEQIQRDINASMRAILIDWLVEVAEEYRLVPDTLYLAVNYIDRYLSSNMMNRQKLQLLGVSCMLIAAKYEEISAPSVEEFCYITDNTYFKEEVLEMESAVLRHLKFEMTAPTIKCFLRRFVRAALSSEVGALQIEFLANYVAELSLLEYGMLRYAPSLIAASAIFLAKVMLLSKKTPWNATLVHYTSYKPSALCECVQALHRLVCNSESNTLPAIREKYSQHKDNSVNQLSKQGVELEQEGLSTNGALRAYHKVTFFEQPLDALGGLLPLSFKTKPRAAER